MQQPEPVQVIGGNGQRGTITQWGAPQGQLGIVQALVRWADGQEVWIPGNLLTRRDDGAYGVPTGLETVASARLDELDADDTLAEDATLTVPVIAEQLDVRKRTVETGVVRVNKTVSAREETVDEPLVREEVTVERVAVHQLLDTAPEPRYDGDTLIVSLVREVMVKRLLVTEELHITKRRVEEHQPQTVTLRTEEASVERVNSQ